MHNDYKKMITTELSVHQKNQLIEVTQSVQNKLETVIKGSSNPGGCSLINSGRKQYTVAASNRVAL